MTNTDGLLRLSTLADYLADAYADVARIEAELASAQQEVRSLSEVRIPELMEELGQTTIRTTSGVKLSVAQKVRCGDLKRADGLAWLRKNGLAGLIKSEVVVPFAKGGDAGAHKLVERLEDLGLTSWLTQRVQWNTLAATIRGQLEDGVDVPLETLGAYLQTVTKIEK